LAWHFVGHGPTVITSPFSNTSTTLSGQSGSWSDSGLSGVLLKQSLFLSDGSSSHPVWRARVRHHPATALDGRMFGRWFVQGKHDLQVPSIKTEFAGCGPLPVTLVGASVACAEGEAVIDWTTASEQDCAEFIVRRSLDLVSWETVATLACSGNSMSLLHYRAIDPEPYRGVASYYRLDQHDVDGTVERFPVMPLAPCGNGSQFPAWPSPFQDDISFDLGSFSGSISVEVHDMAGRLVAVRSMEAPGYAAVRIDGLSQLPEGIYAVVVRAATGAILAHARMVHNS
jgi:hypothetical protein